MFLFAAPVICCFDCVSNRLINSVRNGILAIYSNERLTKERDGSELINQPPPDLWKPIITLTELCMQNDSQDKIISVF